MSGFQEARRPFKVWSSNRLVKKSVTANSLQDLITRGCEKLNLSPSDQLRVVLEDDGTEVDDEDYFAFLPSNSVFMFLTHDEQWHMRAHAQPFGRDEPDAATVAESFDKKIADLALELKHDISRIITFSNEQLQQLVDCGSSDLAQVLGETERFASSIQEACQRHLDERAVTTEAVDLLKLYHKSQQISPYVDLRGEEKKRKLDDS